MRASIKNHSRHRGWYGGLIQQDITRHRWYGGWYRKTSQDTDGTEDDTARHHKTQMVRRMIQQDITRHRWYGGWYRKTSQDKWIGLHGAWKLDVSDVACMRSIHCVAQLEFQPNSSLLQQQTIIQRKPVFIQTIQINSLFGSETHSLFMTTTSAFNSANSLKHKWLHSLKRSALCYKAQHRPLIIMKRSALCYKAQHSRLIIRHAV